jgi:hypothetical protein
VLNTIKFFKVLEITFLKPHLKKEIMKLKIMSISLLITIFSHAQGSQKILSSGYLAETDYPSNVWFAPVEVLTQVLDLKADPNAINDGGYTLLHCAARFGDTEKIIVLLNARANPLWHKSDSSETPLLLARRFQYAVALQLLTEAAKTWDSCNNESCALHPKSFY